MSTQEHATPNNPDRSATGLSGLSQGIVREAEALDASLDRAFTSLREIRTATNRLVAPASKPEGGNSDATKGVPAELSAQLTRDLQALSGKIFQVLNEAGAPPAADAAARKTADGLESMADKLEADLAAWASAAPMPPDAVANLLSNCRSEAQGLQRRLSAPVGKLMSIMQLRDNMDQRTSHVVAAADLGLGAEGQSRTLVEVCLGAQLHGMSEGVREGGVAVGSAATNIEKMTCGLRTQLAMILAAQILPGTTASLEMALSNQADWTGFRPLAAEAEAVEEFVNDTWTDLVVSLGYQWADQHADVEGASKVTDLLDVSAGVLAASAALDDEARAMAEAAIRLDSLKDDLESETALEGAKDIREDPVLPALWDCYTVEDERAVHNTLLDRLAG